MCPSPLPSIVNDFLAYCILGGMLTMALYPPPDADVGGYTHSWNFTD